MYKQYLDIKVQVSHKDIKIHFSQIYTSLKNVNLYTFPL